MSTLRPPPRRPATPRIHYRVACADRHAHLFDVRLRIESPAVAQRLTLPVWIPGSYLVREFSKNLLGLSARQGRRAVPLIQLDKCSWQADCAAGRPLELQYQVCAYDNSVRTAWLDGARGFFNATSVCLRVEGQTEQPHALELVAPELIANSPHWSCATALFGLKTDRHGFGTYRAADYDELADSPVEMGAFWSAEFDVCGVPHRFVVAGAPSSFDGQRLVADARAICETQMRFWHGDDVGKKAGKAGRGAKPAPEAASKPPHDRYLFLLNAVDDGYGGLEHRHSTALICNRRDLPRLPGSSGAAKQPEGYTTLLGLISHEYFHTWNVKRLRPAEFARYDYERENYTRLLWFFEGFTSYYDDLLLRRAGLLDNDAYLRLLNKTLNQVQQTPGRTVQSVAQASFDAWVKYYRPDEQTPNTTVSYYTKGALVALCLDLTLRREGRSSLDALLRRLWQASGAGEGGGPIGEADIATALQAVGGRSFQPELAQWVHGTGELPLAELLRAHGVAVLDDPAQRAQALGLRVAETNGTVLVKAVLRGGAAERAGFAANDEWLGIELPAPPSRAGQRHRGGNGSAPEAWRIARLDDLALYLGPATRCTALVARDRRLLRLALELPADQTTWRLAAQDAQRLGTWLDG